MPYIEFNDTDLSIGLRTRHTPHGPEADIVDLFLEQLREKYSASDKRVAIFTEPLTPNGFPDIVIAEYKEDFLDSWTPARQTLETRDYKLLQHLHTTHGANPETIIRQLGVKKNALAKSLERLQDANLIQCQNSLWRPLPLAKTYGIVALHTIEAKISNWTQVLMQAFMNTWFASESYVMLPVITPSTPNCLKAASKGIGIYSLTKTRKHIKRFSRASKLSLPNSYVSWFFNEWIGRRCYTS